MTETFALRLESFWTPPGDGRKLDYSLKLTNASRRPLENFRLCISGPGRIDPAATVEGGVLTARLSNHAEFAPPDGFVLEPGATWTVTARGLSYPLRHWTDGATSAYVVLADGAIQRIGVEPTRAIGVNAAPKRGAEPFPVPAVAPVTISVIPWPRSVEVAGALPAPAGLDPRPQGKAAEAATAAFAELTASLFPIEGLVRPAAEGGFPVNLSVKDGLGPEAYAIAFSAEAAMVSAATATGFLYGLITLGQILRGARQHPATFTFPARGEIQDEPSLGWRGCHLDAARQFYASAEIGTFLRILAWNKLNRFHWHLSDDEAWRVEIAAYPALTEIGAWRGHGLPVPPLLGSAPGRSGGYYTKPVIREIVALAGRLGIEVVPEIDVPGHCYAMLQALPELRDPDEHGEYFSVQGFPNNCLNPAREETYQVLETIFDELIELFPSKIIHVGADEVPIGAWSGSPQALQRLREIGGEAIAQSHARRLGVVTNTHGADAIEGSGAALLQAQFLGRIQAFLASRGCITGGWEEAAHGNVIDKTKVYLNGWRNVEVCAALAGEGYDMVVNPGQVYYLDMANSPDWSEPGAAWAGWSEPETLYGFDPVKGWSEAQKEHFLGVQCCIWSEPMTDRAVFDRLVFPRLSALAETGWTEPGRKSWDRFKALAGLMPVLYGAT
ncbi:MAG: beta-N-acetylhexosaminidase [Mesorhizobium sp.]|uniref:beta-N-acetylhexosaminidase n=1 Tax=Mesorhizobium sp. TaxID=1871066 RepID=UPI001AC160A3|nr:beta-N-acetylhexosaminidase [Mesorhizobium sp.]MBN9219910.1 beta-N-acetylhexosaminidase [Mesorhizobium sp.]